MVLENHPTLVRFASWVKSCGSKTAASAALKAVDEKHGCTDVMVAYILSGKQLPGRQLAHVIERATADWSGGQIRAEEFDALENERDRVRDEPSAA